MRRRRPASATRGARVTRRRYNYVTGDAALRRCGFASATRGSRREAPSHRRCSFLRPVGLFLCLTVSSFLRSLLFSSLIFPTVSYSLRSLLFSFQRPLRLCDLFSFILGQLASGHEGGPAPIGRMVRRLLLAPALPDRRRPAHVRCCCVSFRRRAVAALGGHPCVPPLRAREEL